MCDRCQSLGKANALGGLIISPCLANGNAYAQNVEICPTCVAEFLEFLAEKPDRGNPAPFTEPYRAPTDEESDEVQPPSRRALTRD